jgi:hypothetical protein
MGKRFLHDVLPPYLSSDEKARCVEQGGETWDAKNRKVINKVNGILILFILYLSPF